MRIVGGTLRGRRFAGPASNATRATPDRVREALASALTSRGAIAGARVLDLFAGTGALAFEAISRGAEWALLVDQDRRAIKAMTESANSLGVTRHTRILALDLAGAPSGVVLRISEVSGHQPFDLVFADPPYEHIGQLPPLLAGLRAAALLSPDAIVAIEHASKRPPSHLGGLAPIAEYSYGDTAIILAIPEAIGEPDEGGPTEAGHE